MLTKSIPIIIRVVIISIFLCLMLFSHTFARDAIQIKPAINSQTAADPAYCIVNHKVGKIVLSVKNNGTFGVFDQSDNQDCFTGDAIHACEYPKSSGIQYLYAGAFWIGAVINRDTLVSEGADGWSRGGTEFSPDPPPFGDMVYRTIRFPDEPDLYRNAVSEEDYIATYTDTFIQYASADYSGRPHVPLFIEVTQRSFAWSYPYAEDFVLFDYEIKNIGHSELKGTYMGLYVDADVHKENQTTNVGHTDDICGFILEFPTTFLSCDFVDTVNIAYIADNDGDPKGAVYDHESTPNLTATRIVRTPADSLDVSFNWWVSHGSPNLDFGPRERSGVGRYQEDFRVFATGAIGTPEGDADKYYQMRNKEFDYDQIYTSTIQPTDTFWAVPPDKQFADNIADGYDTRYLLSFGPFNISPGERLPISFAYIGGENVHTNGLNVENLPGQPDIYYNNLNFSDLAVNAAWASRVYDNPGVDTDGDGYFGKFRICNLDSLLVDSVANTEDPGIDWDYIFDFTLADTIYYEGDGVPDFRGASPPPAPEFWLEPKNNSVKIRFNGSRSETSRDVFSRVNDFEGYRVYFSRDERESSFSMVASFDLENYNKYIWNKRGIPVPGFELRNAPFTIEELRCLYGESCDDTTFNPLTYTRTFPYISPTNPDSIFYFEAQDFNASDLTSNEAVITKVYPNQPFPAILNLDSADQSELTPEGFFKYFEYQVTIENLLPTVPWWFNVTAFDFGSPESGLASLESSKSSNAKSTYSAVSSENVLEGDLDVYTFPNPYRMDANYRASGLEGRLDDDADDRVRRVHFMNLPHKCIIKIYTIDGDMVREIDHDFDINDPSSTHDSWNLITRNTQLAVSGLYYWTVESEDGRTQVGKIVLIM